MIDRRQRSTTKNQGPPLAETFSRLLIEADPQMRALAYSILRDRDEMDDALQIAYLKAFREFGSFEGRSRFSTWLHSIVYRTCIDEIRRRGRFEPTDFGQVAYHDELVVSDSTNRIGDRDTVEAALDRLSPDQRAAVVLVDMQGFTFADAADIVGVPVGTLASRVSRARAALRSTLGYPTCGRTDHA
ncbi:MAG: RNA polymerase sigma factor [Acidimicrobiales bacterium]